MAPKNQQSRTEQFTTAINENPYIPIAAKVAETFRESHDNFTLTLDIKIRHGPGQFVQISLPGIGECPISICSHEGEDLKLNVREVGNMTRALAKLQAGDRVFIRGPYGTGYPMKLLEGNSILLVGGGCGVAPLKGIIEYLEHNRKSYKDVHLVFGFRSPDDILFKRESAKWASKYNVVVSVDNDPYKGDVAACYTGPVGFVTDVLKKQDVSPNQTVAFICGPPIMMKFVIDILKSKGFHDDQIFISAERLMYCAIGKCCHCMIRGKFTCMDGPVFRYDRVNKFTND
ncbi:MAG: oxidoreductase FAD/NAD(P)-binding protein [archaeon GW2011_AR3]|nr:MAG: oxidoreductase FAD/NAD(P)-binding protein [archaeon GW2011_AR3]MBS3109650.1 FAD/NAD(P)-binding protein [Candidatus Woesearchaeota archaeon]